MTQWRVLLWDCSSLRGREGKHNRAEHSFVQSWHLGWSAAGAVLLTALLLHAETVLNSLLPLSLSSIFTDLNFSISLLLISVCPSNMFPPFSGADVPMTHPAHVVIVCGSDAMQAVFKCLIIAQKLKN